MFCFLMVFYWFGGDNVKFMGNCVGFFIFLGFFVYCWYLEVYVKCDLLKIDLKWNENVN